MATVHPSRLRLVPQAPPARPPSPVSREEALRRQLLERRGRRESNGDSRDAKRVKEYEDDREADKRRATRRSRSRSRDDRDGSRRRDRSSDRRDGARHSRRSPSDEDHRAVPLKDARSPRRDDRNYRPHRDARSPRQDDRFRRPSPSYKTYSGPPPPREESFIPLNGANGPGPDLSRYGYGGDRSDLGPPRGPPPIRGGYQGGPARVGFGGVANFEERRQRREASTVSVWPPSPKEPYKDEEELDAERKARRKADRSSKRLKRSKRHTRRYSDESSSETDSEEEERRRRRRRKEKERRARARDSDEDNSEAEERRRRRKSRTKSRTKEVEDVMEEEMWVERNDRATSSPLGSAPATKKVGEEVDDGPEVGPQLPNDLSLRDRKDRTAYSHMLKGEGEAIAAFVESGERIPRRGEIGLDSTTIDAFEQAGYVMSGNRHKRMNAVRMRKENQVINAEEKRAILKLQREEKEKKEGAILMGFKEMMDESLRKQGLNKG
ncbi:ras-induced vulval development antagonist-domain-containing protein [Naematelia encephala]|uniref:Ras-induced vulval development antagonist-domain-containing protein n=1 Tax=Naematelia encephala TaxID=71784 RepID=A0A1Y2BJR4_9TREE|nr:ras-induced vulval development antagonist-domain-containing protein [Naematelia encephala]